MKRVIALAAVAAAVSCLQAAAAQDMVATAGKNAKVVLDNDQVRVIELNMPPGASTGVHSHEGNQLVVFITGGTALQTGQDGVPKETARKPGEVLWSEPVKHDTKNTGKANVRTLVIELKPASK